MRRPGLVRVALMGAVAAGLVYHGLLLVLPQGFNADAATEALKVLDALRGRGGLTFTDFDGYQVHLLPLAPLGLPLSMSGPSVSSVRALMVLYDLLAVWGTWAAARAWFGGEVGVIALCLALFSPWLAGPFSVTVATAAALPMAGIALSESNGSDRARWGCVLLGLSFYAYHTARLGVVLYLALLLLVRRESLRRRAGAIMVTSLMALPVAVLGIVSPGHRKLFMVPTLASLQETAIRGREVILDWGQDGVACPLLFLVGGVGAILAMRRGWRDPAMRLPCLWILGMVGSFVLVLVGAPIVRSRMLVHAGPALFMACALGIRALCVRSRWLGWGLLGLMIAHGGAIRFWQLTDPKSSRFGGWDAGPDRVWPGLLRDRPDWVYVDCRMDDQILFLTDREMPMEDAVFPRTGGATYPWLGYPLRSGRCAYVFWSDSLERNRFLDLFPERVPDWTIRGPSGDAVVDVFVTDRSWTGAERRQIEAEGLRHLLEEAEFWRAERNLLKASCLYEWAFDRYDQAPEAPSSGLQAGLCLIEMGRDREGRQILTEVIRRHPATEEAFLCRQVVSTLEE